MLNLSLRQEYFDAMKIGLKTVEGRVNSTKFKDCQLGDVISFTCTSTNNVILCTITAITFHEGFYGMLQAHGVENMLPGVMSLDQGVEIYESFPGFKDNVKIHGAIAISIKKMN